MRLAFYGMKPLRMAASGAAVLVLTLSLAACGDDSGDDESSGGSDTASTPTETRSPAADAPTCHFSESQEAARQVDLPPDRATITDDTEAVLKTSLGDLKVTLDGKAAPCTVTSFASLADQGYYDDTRCHRLNTSGIYVLQCGDPKGDGTGGPGYTVPDEVKGTEKYGPGVLAMANTGQPNSGGSQFFIVYQDSSAGLEPAYTVFGQLDDESNQLVLDAAAKGTADGTGDGEPAEEVSIEGVSVE